MSHLFESLPVERVQQQYLQAWQREIRDHGTRDGSQAHQEFQQRACHYLSALRCSLSGLAPPTTVSMAEWIGRGEHIPGIDAFGDWHDQIKSLSTMGADQLQFGLKSMKAALAKSDDEDKGDREALRFFVEYGAYCLAQQLYRTHQQHSHWWDWKRCTACCLETALQNLRNGEDFLARSTLKSHAASFDKVTEHAIYAEIHDRIKNGAKKIRQQNEEHELVLGINAFSAKDIAHEYSKSFMASLGVGLKMHHPNWHCILTAIAHRHCLLSIVELIDGGKMHAAQRELKAAQSCDIPRNPPEIAPSGGAGSKTNSYSSSTSEKSKKPEHRLHRLPQLMHALMRQFAPLLGSHEIVQLRRTCVDFVRYRHDYKSCHDAEEGAQKGYWSEKEEGSEDDTGGPCIYIDPDEFDHEDGLARCLAKTGENMLPDCSADLQEWHQDETTKLLVPCFKYSSFFDFIDPIDDLHIWTILRRKLEWKKLYAAEPKQGDLLEDMLAAIQARPVDMAALDGSVHLRRGRGAKLSVDGELRLLVAACRANSPSALACLMHEAGMQPSVSECFSGETPLHAAAKVGSVRLMELICSTGMIGASKPMPLESQIILDDDGNTVLSVAIRARKVDAVRWLVEECGWNLDGKFERDVQLELRHAPTHAEESSRIMAILAAGGSPVFLAISYLTPTAYTTGIINEIVNAAHGMQ
jgi:hypothetical protein